MSTCDPATSTIVSGVYWVTYSKAYREKYDERLKKQNRPPAPRSNRAFIAKWDQDDGWLIHGTKYPAEVDKITIIAGPLEAPYVHL
jgi:hypothetical protein